MLRRLFAEISWGAIFTLRWGTNAGDLLHSKPSRFQSMNLFQKHKINTAFIVPPLMVFLSKSALVNKYDLSSLKVIWCGAAPLSKEVQDAVRERIGVPVIRQGYGMTEGTARVG